MLTVIRPNVAKLDDDFFVSGELLYTYKRGYVDIRLSPRVWRFMA
jgi:hypothetical protein